MKGYLLSSMILFCWIAGVGQVVNTATMDTLETTIPGHVAIGGYVDSYYGYNFSKPTDGNNPYFVSSARNNELTINLAYVDVRYRSKYMRARFVPGFGTYMDANYKNEPGSLRNMVEANVGVKLFDKRNIWVDIGVLGSPYTNESAISKDHLMYTRSFAPENVPYYVTGAKVTVPLTTKATGYFYVINGWQVIQDNNKGKSIATQIEFRPTHKLLLNWNTYLGDERSTLHPNFRTRIFNDFYVIYNPKGKFSLTSCVYYGFQQQAVGPTLTWWQANVIGRFSFSEKISLSGRVEYFHDEGAVHLAPITGVTGFRSFSSGLCLNVQLHKFALFRVEGRNFIAPEKVYLDQNQNPTNTSNLIMTSLTAWF